jgi:hypothetical protein
MTKRIPIVEDQANLRGILSSANGLAHCGTEDDSSCRV